MPALPAPRLLASQLRAGYGSPLISRAVPTVREVTPAMALLRSPSRPASSCNVRAPAHDSHECGGVWRRMNLTPSTRACVRRYTTWTRHGACETDVVQGVGEQQMSDAPDQLPSSRGEEGVVRLIEALQHLCLRAGEAASGASTNEGTPVWQECLTLCLGAGPSASQSPALLAEAHVVTFLEDLACRAGEGKGESGVPSAGCAPPPASPPVTDEEAACVLDWLLYTCVASDAPVPVTSAVYQAVRTLEHRQGDILACQVGKAQDTRVERGELRGAEEDGDSREGAVSPAESTPPMRDATVSRSTDVASDCTRTDRVSDDRRREVLRRRVPWRVKGVHACYARYLIEKYHRTVRPSLSAGNGPPIASDHPNHDTLALFDAFFRCLLLDTAVDTRGARSGSCGGAHGSRYRTLASSAALQLLLLEGARHFLGALLCAQSTSALAQGEALADVLSSFPTLAWLMARDEAEDRRGKDEGSLGVKSGGDGLCSRRRLAHVADACLTKLAPTDSLQEGVLLYTHVLRRLNSLSEQGEGTRSITAQSTLSSARDEWLDSIDRQEALLGLLSSTASSFSTSPSSRQAAPELVMGEGGLDMAGTVSWVERCMRVCDVALAQASLPTSAEAGRGPAPTGGSHDQATLAIILRALGVPALVSQVSGTRHVPDTDVVRFVGRALLLPLPCTAPTLALHTPESAVEARRTEPTAVTANPPARVTAPILAWVLLSHLGELARVRDAAVANSTGTITTTTCAGVSTHGSEVFERWVAATSESLSDLQALALALDQALAHWRRRAQAGTRGLRRTQLAKQQLRDMERSMQLFWRVILRAACDGVFAAVPAHRAGAVGSTPRFDREAGCSPCSTRRADQECAAVVRTLVLPLYTPRYWRGDSVNTYVELLDAWGLSSQLRRVMLSVQGYESRAQEDVWRHIQAASVQTKPHGGGECGGGSREETVVGHAAGVGGQASGQKPPRSARYRPALSLASCETILQHCVGKLEDPQTAAVVVKYMTLSLRAGRLAREQRMTRRRSRTDGESAADGRGGDPARDLQHHDEVDGLFDGDSIPGGDHGDEVEPSDVTDRVAAQDEEGGAEERAERAWLSRIVSTHIPAVNNLFARQGTPSDGAWLEE